MLGDRAQKRVEERQVYVAGTTSMDEDSGRFFRALGAAAADLWSKLPHEQQQALFERAVLLGHRGERDESLREQLAKFLHEHHARTHVP
jgi:hypothetical protein